MGFELNVKIKETLEPNNYWTKERISDEKDAIIKRLTLIATDDWNCESMTKLINIVSFNINLLNEIIEKEFNNWLYDVYNPDNSTVWFRGWEFSTLSKIEEERDLSKSLCSDNYTELLITSYSSFDKLAKSEDNWEFAEFYTSTIGVIISKYVDNYFEYLKYKWVFEHYEDVIN